MELCVTQYWSELHPVSVSVNMTFHSLRPSCAELSLVRTTLLNIHTLIIIM